MEIFFEIFDAKSHIWGQFGPENKLIEGQPNEYDVICRNASVLAFHLWPTIFAGALFRLQNIYRSRTITPVTPIKGRRKTLVADSPAAGDNNDRVADFLDPLGDWC